MEGVELALKKRGYPACRHEDKVAAQETLSRYCFSGTIKPRRPVAAHCPDFTAAFGGTTDMAELAAGSGQS